MIKKKDPQRINHETTDIQKYLKADYVWNWNSSMSKFIYI